MDVAKVDDERISELGVGLRSEKWRLPKSRSVIAGLLQSGKSKESGVADKSQSGIFWACRVPAVRKTLKRRGQ